MQSAHGNGPLGPLHAALDELGEQFLASMSSEELGDRCVSLQSARQRLDGLIAVGLAEAERAGVAAKAGVRTMAQYIAARTHASPDALRADQRVGVWVGQFAQLETAMLDGLLSRHHVDLLRRSENIRVFAAMQRDQQLFIKLAADLEWKSFKSCVKYWLMVNDQDGPDPDDHETDNTCTVSTDASTGRVKLTLDLDPLSGGKLKQALADEENRLFNQDQENGIIRSVTNRRAEAAANLVERGAGRSETNAKPLIHVVMSLKVLLHALAQMAKDPSEQDFVSVLDPNDVDCRCELLDGTPIHPKYALVLLMQARVRRQVLTAKSQTLNASVRTRLFPQWMKDIKLVETRGQCETAGCDAQIHWLQGDHRTPYSATQETTLAELDMLCRPDNLAKGAGAPLAERQAPTSQIPESQTLESMVNRSLWEL